MFSETRARAIHCRSGAVIDKRYERRLRGVHPLILRGNLCLELRRASATRSFGVQVGPRGVNVEVEPENCVLRGGAVRAVASETALHLIGRWEILRDDERERCRRRGRIGKRRITAEREPATRRYPTPGRRLARCPEAEVLPRPVDVRRPGRQCPQCNGSQDHEPSSTNHPRTPPPGLRPVWRPSVRVGRVLRYAWCCTSTTLCVRNDTRHRLVAFREPVPDHETPG